MVITLSDINKNVIDDLDRVVIDEFRKSSFIMDNLPFHDCVSPVGGGGNLTFAYDRVITDRSATFRAFNAEYERAEAKKDRFFSYLRPFGGIFGIDRVFAGTGGIVDEVQFQIQALVKSTRAAFADACINGDTAVDSNAFDGLDKALAGSSTEINASGTPIDLSTSANVAANHMDFIDKLDEFLSCLDDTPTMIAGNTKMINKIRACARRVDSLTTTNDEFGRSVTMFDGVPLVDLGTKAGSNDPIIPIGGDGTTSLYAVRFGLDGFHGVSVAGQPLIRTDMPDWADGKSVGDGRVEMVASVALKSTKAAAVLRNIKVA